MPSGATRLWRTAWANAVDLPKPAPATTVVTGELNRCCSRSSSSARTSSPDTGWGTLPGTWSAWSTIVNDLLRGAPSLAESGGVDTHHGAKHAVTWCGSSCRHDRHDTRRARAVLRTPRRRDADRGARGGDGLLPQHVGRRHPRCLRTHHGDRLRPQRF